MHRRCPLARPARTTGPLAASLVMAALALSACSSGPTSRVSAVDGPGGVDGPAAPAVSSPSTPGPGAGATGEPTAEPSAAPSVAPSAAPSPSVAPSRRPTYDVAAVQRTLADGGYYGGPVDGRPGSSMRSAVMAFQKVNGLGVDGSVGPATLRALAAPRTPVLRASSPGDRVEVDLTRQVLYVVKAGRIVRIMPVSSGNGRTYAQKDGSTARALTPVGRYTIQRRIVGERKADLGSLYDPQYFYRGWAIHGSNSVPAGPASHGCVRVTRTDAKTLLSSLSNGMTVYLYGGAHTFPAGSSAPGTDNPTGDTPSDTAPAPTATASATPSSAPSRQPSTAPASPAPSPSPSRSASPSPSATTSAAPSASPAAR